MKLDTLDIREELTTYIQRCIQRLNANYEILRASLLHKESFKEKLLFPVESLINEFSLNDKLEVKALLKKHFTEEQQRSDQEEERMDLQEQAQDAAIEASYNEKLDSIEAQLVPLRKEQKQQQEKFEVLCQSIRTLMASLGDVNSDLAESQAQLIIKKLASEKLTEASAAGTHAQLMGLCLAENIKKMQCEDGVTLRIQALEEDRQRLQNTVGAGLIQRSAARGSREALRLNRQAARKDEGSPEEALLSPENFQRLLQQIQIEEKQVDVLKKAILAEAEAIAYALFIEQIEKTLDTPKIYHSPEHIALARIIPKMQHYRMLDAKVTGKKETLEKENAERSVFVKACIEKLEHDNHALRPLKGFKKAAYFTAISSTAASLATIAAFTLLVSAPLVIVSSSFLLLAAASATTALILHLYEKRKEKIIAEAIEQMKASERIGSTAIATPSLADRVRLMDESIQKISDKISKHEKEMRRLHLSATEINLEPLTAPALRAVREERFSDDALPADDHASEQRSVCASTVAGRSTFFGTPRPAPEADDAVAATPPSVTHH